MDDVKVVIAGVGRRRRRHRARSCCRPACRNVIGVDRKGAVYEGRGELNAAKQWFAEHTNPEQRTGRSHDVIPGADVFIGGSGPGLLRRDDVQVMAPAPIVFALANPDPEIDPSEAEGHGCGDGNGPQRLPEPDQQRAVLPRHLPRVHSTSVPPTSPRT